MAERDRTVNSKQVIVLGMHRSGTSLLTNLLHAMGCYTGPASELLPANEQNPAGFWERIDANLIDMEILRRCGATWCEISTFSPFRCGDDARGHSTQRIQAVVDNISAHPVSVLKEPRMCLVFDAWRPLLPAPLCIFMVRRPVEVAASLKRRDAFPLQVGIALWEAYTRRALQASEGLPGYVVWHHDLMDEPAATIRALHHWLADAGAAGLRVPADNELAGIVKPALRSRMALASDARELLNESQTELVEALAPGDLNRPVPGRLSLGAQETLRSFEGDRAATRESLRRTVQRDHQVRTTYENHLAALGNACRILLDSRRWRFGQGVFGILDRLRGLPDAPQPADVIRGTLAHDLSDKLPDTPEPEASPGVFIDGPGQPRVIAIMFTYNEQRFIEGAIRHLAAHGVESYVCDNESTDDTVHIARRFLGNEVLRIDHIPRQNMFDLRRNLCRIEELSGILDADWMMFTDPDERHLPPDGDITLAQAFAGAEAEGYNAVNFLECVFHPTREEPDHDHAHYETTMTRFYPFAPSHPHRVTAWKQPVRPVEIAWSGGHLVRFPGLSVYPAAFLMKHYLLLSRDHAIEKYVDRRHEPAAIRRGWHGWRATITAEDITLPPERELRPWAAGDRPDLSHPWKEHWLDRQVAVQQHG